MPRDAGESRLDDAERVLGQIHERATWIVDGKLSEAGELAGDCEGHLEPEPALAASCRVPRYAARVEGTHIRVGARALRSGARAA